MELIKSKNRNKPELLRPVRAATWSTREGYEFFRRLLKKYSGIGKNRLPAYYPGGYAALTLLYPAILFKAHYHKHFVRTNYFYISSLNLWQTFTGLHFMKCGQASAAYSEDSLLFMSQSHVMKRQNVLLNTYLTLRVSLLFNHLRNIVIKEMHQGKMSSQRLPEKPAAPPSWTMKEHGSVQLPLSPISARMKRLKQKQGSDSARGEKSGGDVPKFSVENSVLSHYIPGNKPDTLPKTTFTVAESRWEMLPGKSSNPAFFRASSNRSLNFLTTVRRIPPVKQVSGEIRNKFPVTAQSFLKVGEQEKLEGVIQSSLQLDKSAGREFKSLIKREKNGAELYGQEKSPLEYVTPGSSRIINRENSSTIAEIVTHKFQELREKQQQNTGFAANPPLTKAQEAEVSRMADRIYRLIEKKMQIENERLGKWY